MQGVANVLSYGCVFWLAATARAVGHLQKSTEVMKLVNNLMKAPEIAATMQELSKEMMKVVLLCSTLSQST